MSKSRARYGPNLLTSGSTERRVEPISKLAEPLLKSAERPFAEPLVTEPDLRAIWILSASILLIGVPCMARDFLSVPERSRLERERELEEKHKARPLLACAPGSLDMTTERGKIVSVSLRIRNGGGQTLQWSLQSVPKWAKADTRSGELGYNESVTVAFVIDPADLPKTGARDEIVVEAPDAAGSPITIPIVIEVVEPPPPPPEPPKPVPMRPGSFGVRAGYMMPGSGGELDFDGGAAFGVYYQPRRPLEAKLLYELGLDYSRAEGSDEPDSSKAFSGRLDLLFALGPGEKAARAYLVSGICGIMESTGGGSGNYTYNNYAGALNLGAGIDLAKGKVDIRITHAVLLGSDNVSGLTFMTVGVRF